MPVSTDFAHLTLDIIGRCAFGYHFNTVLSGEKEISSAFYAVIKRVSFGRILRKRFIPLYDYLPVTENRREKEALEITDGTVLEVNLYKFIFQFNLSIYYEFCFE